MHRDSPHSPLFEDVASELLANGHGLRFQARGRSMIPAIHDGDILHVRPIGDGKLKIADIVLFRANGEFKAHRIVGRQGSFFLVRGDAGHEVDGAVSRDQILGAVIAKECTQSREVIRLSGFTPRFLFRLRKTRAWARSLATFFSVDHTR